MNNFNISVNSAKDIESMKNMMQQAFQEFNSKSMALSQAYSQLKDEIARINIELDKKNKELSEKNLILDQNRDFLNNLFDGMTNGIIVVDQKGLVIKFNKVFTDLIGKSVNDLLGKNIFNIPLLSPLAKFIDSAIKTKSKKRYFSGCKLNVDNNILWLELAGSFVSNSKEFLLVVKDLTEVKELRSQLTQNASLADLGQMAVTVAHEIRNPLGGIEGFARLMQRDLVDNQMHSRNIEKIISGVSSLKKFIGDLLSFSKPVNVDVRKIMVEHIINKSIQYSGKDSEFDNYSHIQVTKEFKEILSIDTDPDLLQQIILNLLLNAYQVIETEGEVKIIIDSIRPGEFPDSSSNKIIKSLNYDESRFHLVISVIDSGPGINLEKLDEIFNPFFTTKSFGTGIGLPIVYKIIEALEGRIDITAKSSLGGAEFKLYIPDLSVHNK